MAGLRRIDDRFMELAPEHNTLQLSSKIRHLLSFLRSLHAKWVQAGEDLVNSRTLLFPVIQSQLCSEGNADLH